MHLENHPRPYSFLAETLVNLYHSNLYDVSGGALYGRVDGVALGKVAHGGVVRGDVRQIAAAMEECLGVAVLAGKLLSLLHVSVHVGERLEVAVDELLGLVSADLQSFSQTEDRDAVDDAEVGSLGLRALVAAYVLYLLLIDACGGGGVDVIALAERLYHVLVAREMSHYAQLYL